MKIIFDTNVLLSALITQGLSSRVFDICLDKHDLFISDFIINEVSEKLLKKFNTPKTIHKRTVEFLNNSCIKIQPKGVMPEVCRDKDDNNILFLAKHIHADLIITGDKDLLSLEKFENIKIINPRIFIEQYHNLH